MLEQFFRDGAAVRKLKPNDVTQFLLQHPPRTPKGLQLSVSALRSFLRFLVREGTTDRDLSAAVPTLRSWRLAHEGDRSPWVGSPREYYASPWSPSRF